jgi:hypothetical protein
MEVSSNSGQAVESERHLNKPEPFGKLFVRVLRNLFSEQTANFKFLVQLVMAWFINV